MISWSMMHYAVLAQFNRPRGGDAASSLWAWVAAHELVVYPAIALVTIVLIAGAMIAAWRADDMSAEERSDLKAKIMGVIRRRASGVSAELVGAELQVDLMLADKLLHEMVDEGLVSRSPGVSGSDPARYRIRGSH